MTESMTGFWWTLQVMTASCLGAVLVADVYISPHSGGTKMNIKRV